MMKQENPFLKNVFMLPHTLFNFYNKYFAIILGIYNTWNISILQINLLFKINEILY